MSGGRLFWFTADYPSVFKPYFDTQLAVMTEAGVDVLPLAFCPGPGPWSRLCIEQGLAGRTRYLADDLPGLRRRWGALTRGVLASPREPLTRLVRAARAPGPFRRRLGFLVRTAGMPPDRPAALFVNNLETLVRLRFLRRVYPGVPLAFYYHGGEPAASVPVNAGEASLALRLPDVIFTNTGFSAADVVARGAPAEKVVVVPMGFRLEDYPLRAEVPWPRAGTTVELLSIGRLSREKGHHVAIGAIGAVERAGGIRCRYHLVGDGPERRRLEDQARSLGLEGRVILHGALEDARLAELVDGAHVALQPSLTVGDWTENQACVVQEMMLRGLPVIASRSGGMPECIAPGWRDRMPPPGDAGALADTLTRLLAEPAETTRTRTLEARRFAEDRFDARPTVRGMLSRLGLP